MELLWLAAAVVVIFFVISPLAVWLRLGEEQGMQFEPFDPSRHTSPPDVAAFLRDNIAALASEQFQQVGDLVRRKDSGVTLTTRVALLRHPHGELATIAVVYSDQGSAAPLVEFTAEMTGGRMFDVNNSTSVSVFGPRPAHDVYRFPQVRDPMRLYRVFHALLRRRFGSASLVERDLTDPARFLAESADKEYRAQVGGGYYRFNERTRAYRPTLRGAFLMTWKMLPPFKQLAKARMRDRAGRMLRELGMDGGDVRPVAAVQSVTPVAATQGSREAPARSTPLEWLVVIGGLLLFFGGAFAVGRFTHSGTLATAVLLGLGPFALWLWLRISLVGRARAAGGDDVAVARARSSANRGVGPLIAMGLLVLGISGYREYTGRLPGLTVPSDFSGAIQSLQQLTRQPVSKLDGHDSVYVVRVPVRWANRYLTAAVPKFDAQHFFLSRFDRNFRRDTSSVRLVLTPVNDPFAVLRLIGTHGDVDRQTTEDITAGLRSLNAEQPFEFRNIGVDWVRGAFNDKVTDPGRTARRFNALCPRVLAEDFHGQMDLLERTIARTGTFICRWQ